MTTFSTPYADPGRAAFEELDTHIQSNLLAGPHPEMAPAVAFPLPLPSTYAQFSVVVLNVSGQIVMAENDGDPKAIGVLAQAASLGASGTGTGLVWYSGNFNIDALVWHASFDTDAKKLAAFRGAPTPTTIITAKR